LVDKLKRHLHLEDILIVVYCLFQLILVLVFGSTAQVFLALFYIASAIFVPIINLLLSRSKQAPAVLLKATYPLILFYLFYRVSGLQSALLGFQSHDAFFNNIEASLLGAYPTFILQRIMEVWLNEISNLLYCLGWAVPLAAFYKIYRAGVMNQLKSFILSIELGCFVSLIIASVWPIAGPEISLNDYYYLGFYGPWFSIIVPEAIRLLSPATASFPPVYFLVVATAAYYLWDFGRSYIVISLILITGAYWSGIYLRYHYLADGPVALLIAFFASAVAGYIYRTAPIGSGQPANSS